MKAKEALVAAAFDAWWDRNTNRLVRLPKTDDLMAVRTEFLETFVTPWSPSGS